MYDGGDLLLQLVDELLGIVLLGFDVAQLLFPDTRELTALEQFLADEVYEFDARGGGHKTLALTLDVVALEVYKWWTL